MISVGLGDRNESFFECMPNVLVKFGSGCVTAGADTLKASVVAALINGAPFCYSGLKTGGIGAEDDFRPSVNMTLG